MHSYTYMPHAIKNKKKIRYIFNILGFSHMYYCILHTKFFYEKPTNFIGSPTNFFNTFFESSSAIFGMVGTSSWIIVYLPGVSPLPSCVYWYILVERLTPLSYTSSGGRLSIAERERESNKIHHYHLLIVV